VAEIRGGTPPPLWQPGKGAELSTTDTQASGDRGTAAATGTEV